MLVRLGTLVPVCGLVLAGLIAACSSSPSNGPGVAASTGPQDTGPTCPNDLPKTCPSPIPSYKMDVAPILATYCVGCHSPTGVAGYDEVTYTEVVGQASAILDQVYGCMMPPAGSPMLTLEERVTLMNWLVCNAPDN
jgi:hypothetical protein